jgi:hypothetical protein
MQENINSIISVIDSYLVINSNKPMASDIITYKNYIQTIDLSTLITENTSLNGNSSYSFKYVSRGIC